MKSNPVLDAALDYSDQGIRVFPCRAFEKAPATPHGFKDATLDRGQITEWFGRDPNLNVAGATGKPSGMFVLDVDVKVSDGESSLANLEREHGPLPETLTARTPSGGRHLYFLYPELGISSRTSVLDGVDVRGDGGYIVLPPSRLRSRLIRRDYSWVIKQDAARAPDYLIQLVTQRNGHRLDGRHITGGASQGQRNNDAFRLACRLRWRGVEYNEARIKIAEFARQCSPPFDQKEADRCLDSAYTRYPDGTAFNLNDVGNAQRLALLYGQDLRFCYEMNKWFVYSSGGYWHEDAGDKISRLAKATARSIYQEAAEEQDPDRRARVAKHAAQSESRTRLKDAIELARDEPGIPIKFDEFDRDPMVLAVRNGLIDLRAGNLRPLTRTDLVTKQSPVEFDPQARCPLFEKFLATIFAEQALREYVQRVFGYALTGLTTEQCLFLLFGTGANGKSTLLNVVRDMLGAYAMQAATSTFMATRNQTGPRNDIARLRGARLVSAIEAEDGHRLAEALVKQLTGGDTIAARFLYAEHIEFVPTFKVFLAANHRPTIRGQDHAIWRRIRLIPFDITIQPGKQDRNLSDKLRQELSGILNWALAGCLAWQQHGLGEPPEVIDATAKYRQDMDTLGAFVEEFCVVGTDKSAALARVYEAYHDMWAPRAGLKPMNKNAFRDTLAERGFHCKPGNKNIRMLCGLALRYDSRDDMEHAEREASKER